MQFQIKRPFFAVKCAVFSMICATMFVTEAQAEWKFYGTVGGGSHMRDDSFTGVISLGGVSFLDKKAYGRTGLLTELSVGAEKRFENWKMKGELFFNNISSDMRKTLAQATFIGLIQETPTVSVNLRKTVGLRFLGALPLSEQWSLLAGVDVLWTHYDFDLQTLSSQFGESLSGKKKRYTPGIAPTVGLEYALNERFSLRGTYAYQIHKSIKISNLVEGASPAPANVNLYNYKTTLRPRAHVLKANLVVYF